MEERNVYRDISRRTDGDVYIGVVGPVRTGKSIAELSMNFRSRHREEP